ncbi:MAG TPA: ABC transporter ATP-binding protein [Mycobacteriales bacterium]|nr:ABC transporter ATP-binding protein [Mycobacteriales bacterium]
MPAPVISVRGLRKSYGDIEAVRGIDLEVQAGQVFAFLGPNGAGKTTTVEILEGYRPRDAGEVTVLDLDPARPTSAWYARLGVVLQSGQVQAQLTVRELLELFAGYYPAARPVEETLELVGLEAEADRRAGKLSGGQQRRLDVALALIGDPDLLFLDEPTTGFDPVARRNAWTMIGNLRDMGKTVFLTTHYMDEAQMLADRVAIISAGEIVAEGAPDELAKAGQGATRIRFTLPAGAKALPATVTRGVEVEREGEAVSIRTTTAAATLHALTGWALENQIDLVGLEATRDSLEDVYIALTGNDVMGPA